MRNPLSTALWSSELLARLSPEERAGPRGEKLAGMCLRTLTRLRHLVEDHFLAERLAIRGVPVRGEAIELAEAVTAAAGRVAGLSCAVEIEAGLAVPGDRAMVERALEALLASAARDGAAVRVSASPQAGGMEIAVHGAAPSADALRPPSRSTPSDPTGRCLGLLMAHAVAEAHGGSLDLAADGFLLMLPVEEPSGAAGEGR